MKNRARAVDPAAYKLIEFISACKVDVSRMHVWERQHLSEYTTSRDVSDQNGDKPATDQSSSHSSAL